MKKKCENYRILSFFLLLANRWGVLALATGERYKGQFTKDKRSGKGVAIYPNGCRYCFHLHSSANRTRTH